MGIKTLVLRQYQDAVDRTAGVEQPLEVPPEGWLRTARKALHMSGAQLARRLGATRALVSSTERAELSGGVTLRNMQRMADAMGYRFVYGLVPKQNAEAMVWQRALSQARKDVAVGSVHMALEDQSLTPEHQEQQVQRLARQLIDDHASRLWDDA